MKIRWNFIVGSGYWLWIISFIIRFTIQHVIDEFTVNGEFENFRTYKLESKLKYRLVIKLE
ncbi:hypothetical protein AP3564_04675 [Aeribacillus pallidus]|uniref:Uncharacterized protein n=1 Tax=Aeribacillus pallidus TaxID=33936 RepID=A0A223E345_9BACI|nr:hypothetical protein AP3564_04675 [Aeribacillus pallidus]